MMQETFLRILLSSAVCECRTKFDVPGLLPWCARHDLYMPAFPCPTFPSGKLGMHTESEDNDEPPPLLADSDQELSPHSSSIMIKKSYLRSSPAYD